MRARRKDEFAGSGFDDDWPKEEASVSSECSYNGTSVWQRAESLLGARLLGGSHTVVGTPAGGAWQPRRGSCHDRPKIGGQGQEAACCGLGHAARQRDGPSDTI